MNYKDSLDKTSFALAQDGLKIFLEKRYGNAAIVKGHPKMMAMDTFVNMANLLKNHKGMVAIIESGKEIGEGEENYPSYVLADFAIRLREAVLEELLEFLREALENLRWKECQGLMRIFEMAVTGEGTNPGWKIALEGVSRGYIKAMAEKLDEGKGLHQIKPPTFREIWERMPDGDHERVNEKRARQALAALKNTL